MIFLAWGVGMGAGPSGQQAVAGRSTLSVSLGISLRLWAILFNAGAALLAMGRLR